LIIYYCEVVAEAPEPRWVQGKQEGARTAGSTSKKRVENVFLCLILRLKWQGETTQKYIRKEAQRCKRAGKQNVIWEI